MTDSELNQLLGECETVFRSYMHMPEHTFTVAALWCAHTSLRDGNGKFLPHYTPRFVWLSRKAGCGKSLGMRLMTGMSYRGTLLVEPTSFSIGTLINDTMATLALDEIDLYLGRGNKQTKVRAYLNAGYEIGATTSRRESGETVTENLHAPWILAGKNADRFLNSEAYETLRTRSIVAILNEKPHDAEVLRFNPEKHNARLDNIRIRFERWGMRNHREILSIPIDGLMPDRIANRAEAIWTVLFRIAKAAGGEWPARIEAAARALVLGEYGENDEPMLSPANELLIGIQSVFNDGETFLSTNEIVFRLGELPIVPSLADEWETIEEARIGLSKTLRVFGIEHVRKQIDGTQSWGYSRDAIAQKVPSAC